MNLDLIRFHLLYLFNYLRWYKRKSYPKPPFLSSEIGKKKVCVWRLHSHTHLCADTSLKVQLQFFDVRRHSTHNLIQVVCLAVNFINCNFDGRQFLFIVLNNFYPLFHIRKCMWGWKEREIKNNWKKKKYLDTNS